MVSIGREGASIVHVMKGRITVRHDDGGVGHRCLDTGSLGARGSWSSLRSSCGREMRMESGTRVSRGMGSVLQVTAGIVVHCESDKFSNLFYFFSSSRDSVTFRLVVLTPVLLLLLSSSSS